MSRSITGAVLGTGRRRWTTTAVAIAVVAGTGTALAVGTGTANAATPTAVTRAALAPSLVAGRGAGVAFNEQEAENAATNGAVIPFDTSAYTVAGESSGRSAVSLTPGQYVEFTLPAAANAITVRYSIPDAPTGGGITAPLDIVANGHKAKTMTLTSAYSYLYNIYPFTNDPHAAVTEPNWWLTECACVPSATSPAPVFPDPLRPAHFYDEQRVFLGRTYKAGDTIRLSVPANSTAATTVIDLMDSELVGLPKIDVVAANVLLFGADPTGRNDSADAFDKAIAFAKKSHLKVYVPPGTYQVNRHIIVDNVTIEGAGNWYTVITGHQVTLSAPAADGSVHTGVGFYGKDVSVGGSSNVHLSGFSIVGDVKDRIDTDQVNGIGGAFNNSSFDGLYIDHTKCGIWLDGPMTNVSITNNIIVGQIADGINFHGGITNSTASNNFIRNTGDDAMAMWSDKVEDANNTFDHNTIQNPVLANGVALYGGTDNTVSNNLIADPLHEGSAIQLGSRFGAEAFTGHAWITNNTTVRSGTLELNWNIGLGAIWIYALEKSITADVEVVGDNFLDNTYDAMMIVSDYGVKDLYSVTNVHFKDIHVDGAGTDVISTRAAGSATFENVDVRNIGWWGVNNCGSFHFAPTGSEFSLTDLGGNDGNDNNFEYHPGTNWLGYYLPNAITCNDRPTVVPPPAPSAW
jgi:hypothetical protein